MPIQLESLVSFPKATTASPVSMPEPQSQLLIGEVSETPSVTAPHHVVVRWLLSDGTAQEQSLAIVRGLVIAKGDRVLIQRPANGTEWIVTHALGGNPTPSARVQRKRITIEGKDEIVLQCGEASLTLRRNGRVVLRGTYVESRSKGTNRIKGGSVLIN